VSVCVSKIVAYLGHLITLPCYEAIELLEARHFITSSYQCPQRGWLVSWDDCWMYFVLLDCINSRREECRHQVHTGILEISLGDRVKDGEE
jgi:hypothetical protein